MQELAIEGLYILEDMFWVVQPFLDCSQIFLHFAWHEGDDVVF